MSAERPLLYAFAVVLFAGVDVAARVGCDAADGEEASWLPSAGAEGADLCQRVTPQDDDRLVVAVGDVEVLLLRIARQRDVPGRSPRRHDAELADDGRAHRVLVDDAFL